MVRPLRPLLMVFLGLRGINDNPIQVCSLVVEAIVEPSNSDGVARTFVQRELQRRGQDDALVSVSLEESLQLLGLSVDHNAADAT